MAARTAQANQIRGLLYELGIVIPKGVRQLEQRLPEILEDAENGLVDRSRDLFARLFELFRDWASTFGSSSCRSRRGIGRAKRAGALRGFLELGR